jgi:hypothetical protein
MIMSLVDAAGLTSAINETPSHCRIRTVEISSDHGQEELIAQMAELLAPIFRFIAAGVPSETMDERAWAVAYVMRPDILQGETMVACARRLGVSMYCIRELVYEFRSIYDRKNRIETGSGD